VNVVTYRSEFTRPDLAIPLSPLRGFPLFVRHQLLGLRAPRFAAAYRVTLATAAGGLAVAASSLAAAPPWRDAVIDCSALIGLYVLIRAWALMVFERRQRSFEPLWLAAQSDVLRGHSFEVLRFAVQDLTDEGQGARRGYDLARPDDVDDLLRRQANERNSGRFSRATAEFTYPAGEGTLAVGDVHRDLTELTFMERRISAGHAWIRFPEARYLGRPGPGKRPAAWTDWVLSGPVVIAVGTVGYGGAAGVAHAPGAPAESSELGASR
jgi:hypothetical protein